MENGCSTSGNIRSELLDCVGAAPDEAELLLRLERARYNGPAGPSSTTSPEGMHGELIMVPRHLDVRGDYCRRADCV
jgi:hypothetical protein